MMAPPNKRPKILVVDDEDGVRKILVDFLSDDYDCVGVSSAELALTYLERSPVDLVLSDITMQGMSGLEMISHLRRIAPHTIVAVISGMLSIENAIGALREGAFDYVMKPFKLEHIELLVTRALEQRQMILAREGHELLLEELVKLRTEELDRTFESLEDAYRATLCALTTALETRDFETHGHSERVVNYSLRLGREYGLDRLQLKELEFGALLHDIGKIGVPDAILRKPGTLLEDEWKRMKEHPLHGNHILGGVEFLRGPARVVAQHHEQWDGRGYPAGLRAEEIDICARIFSVADAFDAMTSDRVYRAGKSYDAAAQELDDWSGRQFDPGVIAAFHRIPKSDWDEIRLKAVHRSFTEEPANRLEPTKVVGLLPLSL